MGDLLLLLALISVNLAIVNFLPIPITDGGHFMFLLYEKIRGRRMSEEVQGVLLWAGLAFLLAVFVLVTWNDLARIIFKQ
jgi:regulator of sigma E protease